MGCFDDEDNLYDWETCMETKVKEGWGRGHCTGGTSGKTRDGEEVGSSYQNHVDVLSPVTISSR